MIKDIINSEPVRQPVRPLGAVSDFACEKIQGRAHLINGPHDLKFAGVEEFAVSLEELAPDWRDHARWQSAGSQASIALLDLKMVYTLTSLLEERFRHNYFGATVNNISRHRQEMEEKIRDVSKEMGRAPIAVPTYEDLVLVNPEADTRTFLGGAAGKSERAFYLGHARMETMLHSAITNIKVITEQHELTGEGLDMLRDAHGHIRQFALGMRKFRHELNTDHFNRFRVFFSTNPCTGEKGASGAFSAKVPHMDVLIYGSNIPASTLEYIENNKPYFPAGDLADCRKSMATGKSLVDFAVAQNDIEVHERARQIAETMLGFRRMHKSTAIKHMGHNFVGTGEGATSEQFLESRIDDYQIAFDAANTKLLKGNTWARLHQPWKKLTR